ncbi:MMPL family transporter [Sulfurirhabdus autotrophica]|nr:MMPL family transporter [Sulfurirhabdus autotrophica]
MSRWAIGLWLAFIVACIFVISRTEFSTDLSAFLPRSPTPAQQVLVEQLREGVVSRLILVGLEGATPEILANTSKQLAAQLRTQADFVSVNNGEHVGEDKDHDFLWKNRYLLSPAITPAHFSVAALRNSLEEALQLLGSPAGTLVKKILKDDPSGELIRLLEQLEGQARPAMQEGVWFSKEGKRALLVLQTKAAGYDIDAQESAIAVIQSTFARVAGHDTSVQLQLSGPGVFSVSTRERIKGDAWRFSLIATVLIACLLLLVYRSFRVLILGLLPVASGALAGIAAVSLGFGSVHGITLGFGATLIGEGVDYAIYLFTQIAPSVAPKTTFKRIWPTLRLGVLTSICGFSAMLFSGFPGLAQLGMFSIVGLIVAVTVTRWVLPALLPQGFTARAVTSVAPTVMALVKRAPVLRIPLLLLVASAFVVLIVLSQRGPLWSDELSSLSPLPKADQLLDEQLRNDIGAPDVRYLIVVNAKDAEAALQASENIAVVLGQMTIKGALQGFESPATYLPSLQMQRVRQAALPTTEVLRENLQLALRELPFQPDLFKPFLENVAQAKTQPLSTRSNLQGTNLALKLDSLLVKRAHGWAAMLSLRGVTDPEAITREIAKLPGPQAIMLDMKYESDQLYQTYRHGALTFSMLGGIAIVILLFANLRSPRRVFEVLAPLAAAVIIVTCVLVLNGHMLSIFHLVGLLLVVAVGSNYSLFFDRPCDTSEDRERMLVSLLFANIATMIGFGLLSFSHVPLLKAIGSTVGMGAILSLVFSAILIVRQENKPIEKAKSKV